MTHSVIAKTWLYTMLTGDAQLAALIGDRAYDAIAPDAAVYPFIVFSTITVLPVQPLGGGEIMAEGTYDVKVIGKGRTLAPLAPIASRIKTVLNGGQGAVTGGLVLACTFQRGLDYPEIDKQTGTVYRHLGGTFQVLTQEN